MKTSAQTRFCVFKSLILYKILTLFICLFVLVDIVDNAGSNVKLETQQQVPVIASKLTPSFRPRFLEKPQSKLQVKFQMV